MTERGKEDASNVRGPVGGLSSSDGKHRSDQVVVAQFHPLRFSTRARTEAYNSSVIPAIALRQVESGEGSFLTEQCCHVTVLLKVSIE